MTDDMLRALAKNGGVVSINFNPGFVNQVDAEAGNKRISEAAAREPDLTGAALDEFARQDYMKDYSEMRPAAATIDDVVAHIDHAVKVAGIDHVGIGSDFDGINSVPQGLEDVSKMPALTAALLKRGYKEREIRKIMGGNFLRVMREVVGN
jgi:membrane dipeptidase